MRTRWHLALRALGWLVAVAAIFYFATFVLALARDADAVVWSPEVWIAIGLAALLYMISFATSGWGYHRMLADLGARASPGLAFGLVATSQIAKYLPGNIGPWIGRPAMGASFGIAPAASLRAMIYESLIAIATGGVVGAVALAVAPRTAEAGPRLWMDLAGVALAVVGAAVLATFALPRMENIARRIVARAETGVGVQVPHRTTLLVALAFSTNFLAIGFGVVLLSRALGIDGSFWQLTGIFALAWIAGFIIPGPPAGLGVREGLMVALMQGTYAPADCAQLVLLHRIATTFGDLAAFAAGTVVLRIAGWQRRREAGQAGAERSTK